MGGRNHPPGNDALLGAIFDSAALGIAVVSADGRLRAVNPVVLRLTGYTEDELVGRRFVELTHPDDVAGGVARFAELLAGNCDAYTVELRYLGKDGAVIWARVSTSIKRDTEPPVVISILEDITTSRAAEVTHRDLVLALGERVKELTALHRATRIMVDASRSREQRLLDIARLLPPAMQYPEITTACVRVGGTCFASDRHAATPWLLTAPFQTSDGTRGEIEVAYHQPRPDAAAGPFLAEESALLASLADMIRGAIDRDLADEELRRANERLNLALDAAGMAVWEWNLATGTARWSRQFATMTGYDGPLEDVRGARAEYIHPDDRDRVDAALVAVAATGQPLDALEFRMRRPDGGWRPVIAYTHGGGDVAGERVIAAIIDVSVRHALEAGLRQAQKLEALGQVASGVAHDFNNLLAVMTASSEYLLGLVGDGHPWREVIDDLHAAASSGAALTRQLLTFSRNAAFAPAVVDLGQLVTSLQPLLERLVRGHASLEVELDPVARRVWADPTQLEQVLMNLVVNARDAMGEPGVITVSTGGATGEGGQRNAVLTVRDTGPGISAELARRIFEPFFTTKEPGQGTGLGLAVVANVARQWHGKVALDSAPGQGAAFHVLLPQLDD